MILSKDSCFLKRTLVAKVKKQEPGCWERHRKVSSGWILLILQEERRAKPPNNLSEQDKIWRCDWELGGNSRSQNKLHWFQLHQKGINLVQGQILGFFFRVLLLFINVSVNCLHLWCVFLKPRRLITEHIFFYSLVGFNSYFYSSFLSLFIWD